jgi:hypothetical protein
MLIGMKQMHETRYQKMWNIFENLVKQQIISNKSVDNINLPDYDDGTMAMKIINKEGDAK